MQWNAAADDTVRLIDGSGFIFRAFHATPPLTRADGTPINAVMGFCNMLWRMVGNDRTGRAAVIFDAARRTFRMDIHPGYKSSRKEAPEELKPQFPIIREAVRAFGIPCVELDGWEADDILAAYARLAVEAGLQAVVVTSDKDLMQLVRPGVTLLDPAKDKIIGPEEVFGKFGVRPDQVVDVQALAGDPTDDIPGVAGIGLKTAAALISEFGSLEALLAGIGSIPQEGRRKKIQDGADSARLSKRLAGLDDHAPVPLTVEDLRAAVEIDAVLAFAERNGLSSFAARVRAAR